MAGAAPTIEGNSPNFEPESCTINCPHSVLLEIRAAVLDAFNNLPHGGPEIFGILFGKREGRELRVVALHALPSGLSSSSGLSPEDLARFNAALAAPPAEGEPHEAVGWFRAHPRTALELSACDVEIFNVLFSEPWQVGMVMRPGNAAATKVRFYMRDPNGAVGEKYQELTLLAPLDNAGPGSEQALDWEMAPRPVAEVHEPPQVHSEAQADTDAEASEFAKLAEAVSSDDVQDSNAPPKWCLKVPAKFTALLELRAALKRAVADKDFHSNPAWRNLNPARRNLVVLPLILITCIALVAGLYWLTRQPPQLALHLADAEGQLRVAWNRKAASVEPGERANLDIMDGNSKVWLELTPEQLRNGSITYARQSNDVSVRLTIERPGKAAFEESARFLGSARVVSNLETLQRELTASRERLDRLLQNHPPEQAPAPRRTPELVVDVPVAKAPESDVAWKDLPVSDVAPKETPAKNGMVRAVPSLPAQPGKASADESAHPVAVAQLTPPASLPHTTQPTVVEQHNLPAPPIEKPVAPALKTEAHPSPGPPPPTVAPAAAGTRSGRIIWTGRVPKNGTITIDGKNSSVGSFSGELPAKPVRLSVSPGDLSSDGIVLYSSNLQYANSVLEPASQQNGWNKTVYTYNPRLAADIIVVETPDGKNGWNRLVLRNKNPKISVIVIDWAMVN